MGWPIIYPSTIYGIRCKRSGRVYIGRTYRLEARIKEHFTELRKGRKTCYKDGRRVMSNMQKDYDKYGEDMFDVYIIEEDVSPDMCKEREAYWIEKYRATDVRYGYNRLDEKKSFPLPKHGIPPAKAYSPKLAAKEAENQGGSDELLMEDSSQKSE